MLELLGHSSYFHQTDDVRGVLRLSHACIQNQTLINNDPRRIKDFAEHQLLRDNCMSSEPAVSRVVSQRSAIQSLRLKKNPAREDLGTQINLLGNLVFGGVLNGCICGSSREWGVKPVVGCVWQ